MVTYSCRMSFVVNCGLVSLCIDVELELEFVVGCVECVCCAVVDVSSVGCAVVDRG